MTQDMIATPHSDPRSEKHKIMTRTLVNLTWGQAPCETTLRPQVRECIDSLSVRRLRTASPTPSDCQSDAFGLRSLRYVVTLLLMLVVGVSEMWGQTVDYSGTYYIASGNTNGGNNINNIRYNSETPADNFYLCPTDENNWIYYQAESPYFTDTKNGQPFLTTYKYRAEGEDATEAQWIIKKVQNSDYYHIIHKKTTRYLTYNDIISTRGNGGSGKNRIRFHLQSTADDNSLFRITQDADVPSAINIAAVAAIETYYYNNNNCIYLNLSSKDDNTLKGTNGKTDGPTNTYQNVGATIGIWYDPGRTSEWFLEDVLPRPTIGYDAGGNIKITNNATSATVYYSIGENSDPKTSATSFTGTDETLSSFTDGTVIKAIAKVGNEYSKEVTFTAIVHVGSSNQYLIQTVDGGSYYMVPPITTETNVTTTNIPHEKMAWYFDYVGQEAGIQYYNITNANTSQYLYCSGSKGANAAFRLKGDGDTDADRYKFVLVPSGNGYNVIPKKHFAETTGMCMSKKDGNNATDYLNLSNGTDDYSRWKFVAVPSSPKTQFDASFASTASSMKCYLIKSANSTNNPKHHLLPPTTDGGNATAAAADANPNWFLLPVEDNDEWIPYYHIKNEKTGEYLYFDGEAGANNTFFTSTTIGSGNENRYKFIIVKSASTDYTDAYNIIPYALKDQANQVNNSLNRTGTALQTKNSRGNVASLWQFEEVCLDPSFEQSGDNIIVSYYNASDVYYTTDGSDPSTSGTLYESPTWPSSTPYGIRVIAKLKSDPSVTSSEITLLNKPNITLEAGPYPYKGAAWEPAVTDVSIGSIAAPTSPATYSVSYTNNTNAGTATVNVSDNNASDTWYIMNATKPFTIDRAEATVTADYKTKVYETTPSADPTLTATVTGLVNNESETLITYTLSRVAGEEVGSYTITPTGDEVQGNYHVTYETGVFQIGYEIHPTVSLTNRVYGDPIEPSVTGGGEGAVTYYYKEKDAADDTYTEEQPVDVGNYTVKADVAATPEYFAATTAPVNFSITKRALTVTADAITKEYRDEDPELTYTIEGIQYNEERNDVLICVLQRAAGEDKGEYDITKVSHTLVSDKNYSFTDASFTAAKFTITAKNLGDPVTFAPAPKISIYAKKDEDPSPWVVSVYTGKTAFTQGTDYTSDVTGPDGDGNYTITVTAVEGSNCTGAAKATYSVNNTFYDIDGTTEKFTPYISTTSDQTTSSDLVPYIVTQVNSSIGTVSIVPISYIPKDEPVLLLAQSDVTGITTSPKNAATTPISESLISNNKLNVAPEGGTPVENTEAYMFYKGEFVLTTAGTIKEGKFFLYNPNYNQAPSTDPAPSPKRSLAIVKDETTGIIQLTSDEVKDGINDAWYSIDGQKFNKKPTRKGIYIQNGKKIIVK